MVDGVVVFYALAACAAGLSLALARVDRRHMPIAGLLLLGLLCDAAAALLRPLYVTSPRPFYGGARVAAQAGQAAFTAYPFSVLAVALLVLGRGRRGALAVGAAWLAYEAFLVGGYHPLQLRGDRLGMVYLFAQVGIVLALAAVVVAWWWRWRARKAPPSGAEVVALAAAGAELVVLAGPMLLGQPWGRWGWARAPYTLVNVVAIVVQGGALWVHWRR